MKKKEGKKRKKGGKNRQSEEKPMYAVCLSEWYYTLDSPMHSPYLSSRDPWAHLPCACLLSDSIVANAATVGYSIYLNNTQGTPPDGSTLSWSTGRVPAWESDHKLSPPSPSPRNLMSYYTYLRYLLYDAIHLNLTATRESLLCSLRASSTAVNGYKALSKYGVS